MCSSVGAVAEGDRPGQNLGRQSLQGWPSLSSALSPNTERGKESYFEVKLLKHHPLMT